MKPFKDRLSAGALLGEELAKAVKCEDIIILALPRGGVPVAFAVAQRLGAPLDVLNVRKLGVPFQPELAFGSLAPDGTRFINKSVVECCGLSSQEMAAVEHEETLEIGRREFLYRGSKPIPKVKDKTVIIVDDGLATGATMHAAVQWVKAHGAREAIVAVPVASQATCDDFTQANGCNRCFCLMTPEPFYAVGVWYSDFSQVNDADVRRFLDQRAIEPLQAFEATEDLPE